MKLGAALQQPDERLDYDFLYNEWFGGTPDTLAAFSAEVTPSGLTLTAAVASETKGKIWVSDGVAGTTYYIAVTATSTAGRIKQDELEIIIEEIV